MADTSKINKILNYYGLKTNIEETKKWVKQYVNGEIQNIDLSEVAKQGNDSGATNTAIYIGTNDIKNILNSGKILVEITSSEIDDMIDRIIGDDIQ